MYQIYNILIFYNILTIIIISYIIIIILLYFFNNNVLHSFRNICEISFISYIIRNIFLMCYNILLNIKDYNDIIYENILFIINRVYILSEYQDATMQYLLLKGYTFQQVEVFLNILQNLKIFEKELNMQSLYKIIDQMIFELNTVNNNIINKKSFFNYLNDYMKEFYYGLVEIAYANPYATLTVLTFMIPLCCFFIFDLYIHKDISEIKRVLIAHQDNFNFQNIKNHSNKVYIDEIKTTLLSLEAIDHEVNKNALKVYEINKQFLLKSIDIDRILLKRLDVMSTTLLYMGDIVFTNDSDLEKLHNILNEEYIVQMKLLLEELKDLSIS